MQLLTQSLEIVLKILSKPLNGELPKGTNLDMENLILVAIEDIVVALMELERGVGGDKVASGTTDERPPDGEGA